MIKKVLQLPTNDDKVFKQLLAFLNFDLNASPQERDVIAEIIKLNNDYEALPAKQRAKFILSTDMRKEMRTALDIKELQFNTIISRIKQKTLFGQPLFDENGVLHSFLHIKPDNQGLQLQVNLVNTVAKAIPEKVVVVEQEVYQEPTVTHKKLATSAEGVDNIIDESLESGFTLSPIE